MSRAVLGNPAYLGLLVLLVSLGACRQDDQSDESQDEGVVSEELTSAQREAREARARAMYEIATGTPPPEKIDRMRQVLRRFWDTSYAPLALQQMAVYGSMPETSRPAMLLEEIRWFRRRFPQGPAVLNAISILGGALHKRHHEAPDLPQTIAEEPFREEATALWLEIAKAAVEQPDQ
ncbi:MAG: hypothetical protein KDB53_01525, partial [Planctomycetes bacterium]|nr:hypothetical protein [Planctomycetota bacterium]